MKKLFRIFLLTLLASLCLCTFAGAESLTELSIPEGTTTIAEDRFSGHTALERVKLPASVITVHRRAFKDCTSLKFVYYSGSKSQRYAMDIFSDNYSLDYAHWVYHAPGFPGEILTHIPGEEILSGNCGAQGNNVTWQYGTQSHVLLLSGSGEMRSWTADATPSWNAHKEAISTVVIADGITNIGDRAFSGCENLTWVEIPESVISIGANSFYNCSSLAELEISDSVTSIGNGAFRGCENLARADLPAGLTEISNELFYNCASLTETNIPNGVEHIGDEAFCGCESIKELTIPDSVTSIGTYAFVRCTGLTEIVIPDSISDLGAFAFYNCVALSEVQLSKNLTVIKNGTFASCNTLKKIIIPEGVTTIENGSESGDWTIPGRGAFSSCALESVTLPTTLTYIGTCAFTNCWALTEIRIPDSVTAIGSYAFEFCDSLKTVKLPAKIETVSFRMFSRCPLLTEITLPETLKTVSREAFYGTSLDTVYYEGSESQWGKIDFTTDNGQLTGAYILYGQEFPSDEPETSGSTVSGQISGGVSGATVEIGGESVSVNEDGSFSLPAEGTFNVVIKVPGALSYTVKNVTAEGGDVTLPEIVPVKGDVNGDDMINIMDMGFFRANFGKVGANIANPYTDVNGDNMVNIMDMGTFRANFGKTAAKDCTVEYGV